MTITAVDLLHFTSETVTDGATNGGLPSENQAQSGERNNIWPNVSADDRVSGVTQYRKLFGMVRDTSEDVLSSVKAWLHAPTEGEDYVYMFAGTKTDTEADFDNSTKYAAANLNGDITIGDTSCIVVCESAVTTAGFHADGKVVISNQTYPGTSGDSVTVTLSSTPPLVNGLLVTLYFSEAIDISFNAVNTSVGAVMEPGDLAAEIGTPVVTSTSGIVDEIGYPPVCNNKGTRDEILTVSFATTTTFTVSGSRSGSLGSGDVSTDFIATNPLNSATLITIPAGFFSASGWVALDTVTIPTVGSNFAYWEARVVPAGCGALRGNEVVSAYAGESG